jgi:hypothetical protein
MKTPEKRLVMIVAGLAGVLVLWFVIDSTILGPAARYRAQGKALRGQIDDCRRSIGMEGGYRGALEDYKARTFGPDGEKASEEIRQWMTGWLTQTRLDGRRYQVLPASGPGHRGMFTVAGRGLSVSGPLAKVVDLVYLLAADGHVGRIDSLRVGPADNWKTPDVAVALTYLSPILVDRSGRPLAASPDAKEPAAGNTDSRERRGYDAIADRDLFRPFRRYVPPEEKPGRDRGQRRGAPIEPAAPAPTVTGLPRMGRLGPEVIITEASGQEKCLKVGDPLAGGTIVMVDYRPMPLPDSRQDISTSRVIVRIGQAYWAIERGQNLESKRRLSEAELPAELPRPPASQPAPTSRNGQ